MPNPNTTVILETTLPALKKSLNTIRHNPMDPKKAKNHGPKLLHIRTMHKQVIDTFAALLAQTAPLHQNETTPSQIIHSQNLL
jgi:hypothetical protein